MKPGCTLELMAFDVLNDEQLKTLRAFYKAKNYGGAESWFLTNFGLPIWRKKVSLDPEYAR